MPTLLLPDGDYDFEILECRVLQERVPQMEDGSNTRVEFDLRVLTGPERGKTVTDWTNLVAPNGAKILGAKLRRLGIRVPDSWGVGFLRTIGPDLRGVCVRVGVTRKVSAKGNEYAYYYFKETIPACQAVHPASAEDGEHPLPSAPQPQENSGYAPGNCLSEAESEALARLYSAPPAD